MLSYLFPDNADRRLDHKIGSNDTLFGRYTLSDESTFNPGVFPRIGTYVVGAQFLQSSRGWLAAPTQS